MLKQRLGHLCPAVRRALLEVKERQDREQAERLYGWTANEALGRKTTDLLGQNRAIAETAKGKVMELGEWAGEVRQTTEAGQEVTVSCRWTLLQEPGSPPVILTINTDVTEYKKLELQFLRAQRLESIGRLASGIAHDLNNILAPMLMAPSIIREELHSESAKVATTERAKEFKPY